MAQHKQHKCWVKIPLKERLKIQWFSLVLVVWVLIKYAFELLWKSEKKNENWDRPPSCLIDNAIGYHSYVKLQVIFTYKFVRIAVYITLQVLKNV